MNPHYIFVHNIFAPYRMTLFNELQKNGFDFEVFVMQKSEKGRSWDLDMSAQHYSYRLFSGLYWHIFSYALFFNPGLIWAVCKDKKSHLILGASWNNLNVVIILLLKWLHIIRNPVYMWSEANGMTLGARKKSRLKFAVRKWIFNRVDQGVIVPTSTAIRTLQEWGIQLKRTVFLPNMVQEEIIEEALPVAGLPDDLPVFVLPARLLETLKGQLNFFEAIGTDNIRKVRFYLLGDGGDEKVIRKYISDNHLDEHICLAGFLQFKEVSTYMKRMDVFCLPSFSDSCPLALYEALACGKPLLVSARCGNTADCVHEKINGISFDPADHHSVKEAFEWLLDHRDQWQEMGQKSRELYETTFSKTLICKNFIRSINQQ